MAGAAVQRAENVRKLMRRHGPTSLFGAVDSVSDLAIKVEDRLGALEVGTRVDIETDMASLSAEVVGVSRGAATCLPFGPVEGVRRGARVSFRSGASSIRPSDAWLGGVCGGLEPFTGVAAWVWRLIFVALVLCGGTGVVLYLLLWFFVPRADDHGGFGADPLRAG